MEEKDTSKIEQKPTTPVHTRTRNFGKIREGINTLPNKKPHLDFIAALLTIPLLAITLYLNFTTLKNKNTPNTMPTPAPTASPLVPLKTFTQGVTPQIITITPQPTTNTNTCVKDIGPIDISYPSENQTVSDNPLCINIDYQVGNYCSVVWSYKINTSDWSDYSNNSVCLYNLPTGSNTFALRIKSLSSASTKTLQRNFLYKSLQITTPTPAITTALTPTTQ